MECNKEEAIRAKEIAEKKMQSNDFAGARRIALKAQQLFPELENITQILTVCNVHCSAENKILGTDKDWYSILQVERLADDATIKKQYRKLALVLHPDKNKFSGAEAAFKLIGEAHVVLSDRGKRSLFDSKIGISLKCAQAKPPSRQVNMNPPARKQSGIQNNIQNGSNHHQATQFDSTVGRETFWTCCAFCKVNYQYMSCFVNRVLRCTRCSKPFVAYDIAAQGVSLEVNQSQAAAQGVPPQTNWSQPAVSKPKEDPIQGTYRCGAQKTAGSSASNLRSQGSTSSRTVGSVSGTEVKNTAKVGLDDKTKDNAIPMGGGNEGAALPKEDFTKPGEAADPRNKYRKRGRKQEPESSCDTSSSSDLIDLTFEESGPNPAGGQSSEVNAFHFPRRSSRQKHQVSYNDSGTDDDDFESPPKRSREGKSSSNGDGWKESIVNDTRNFCPPMEQKEKVPSKGGSPTGNTKTCKNQSTGQATDAPNRGAEKVEIVDDDTSPQFFDCPEPEFNDFDKGKVKNCFAVGQFWACYAGVDGMPRFYVQIRRVYSTGFKLRITWLESDPDDQGEIDWVKEGLPVGCGKFRHGDSDVVTDCLTFSHQILCERGAARGSFMIYPRKGETWALFKDWDIKWSTDPGKHKQYKYEIVEVVSDFMEDAGVEVAFLDKLRGFVSLFQRRSQNRTGSILIPPTEIFRFSHRIPSFKMSGTEKESVPKGSFELDPACLPANPDDSCYPFVVEVDANNLGAEANCSDQELSKNNKSKLSECENTPKKPADFVKKSGFGGETSILRRSPRGLKSTDKENSHASANHVYTQGETANHLNSNKGQDSCEFSPSKADVSTCFADKELDVQLQESSSSKGNRIHLSPGGKVSEDLFYDFEEDRSEGKFEVGQIWALYIPEDKMPKMYGQIKKIGCSPFKLFVAPLEACSMPKQGIQPVCGTFNVKNGKLRAFEPSSFSHLLEAKFINKNRFEIYPKVGEVWAIYRNWDAELLSSELKICEYQLMEIMDLSGGCTKVLPLVPVKHYKSVFRSPRRQRSGIETIDIQGNEFARFSHRIPAFQLTTEKGGSLLGAWQLDPASVPRNLASGK